MGSVHSVTDHARNEVTSYEYDLQGRVVKSVLYDAATYENRYGMEQVYDDESRVSFVKQYYDYPHSGGIASDSVSYRYEYDDSTKNLSKVVFESTFLKGSVSLGYNHLLLPLSRALTLQLGTTDTFYYAQTYTYREEETDRCSGLIETVQQVIGKTASSATVKTYRYTYDANGNITKITDGNNVVQYQYTYDALGQLIREDNRPLNKTYVYTYDEVGDIWSKKSHTFTLGTALGSASTTNYRYDDAGWGDLLTQYGNDHIKYDEIGNPIKKGYLMYSGEFEFGYEYFWDGRELKSIKYFDYYDSNYYTSSIDFTYNADGIRTSKTVYGVEHKYYLNGSQIIAETWTQNGVEHLIVFVYDETGSPMALKYRTSEFAKDSYNYFFYEKNLQGDIVGIYNSNGVKIGTYNYDAWGAHTPTVTSGVTSLESLIVRTYNPFRYRGYYYDTETSLYYLQSRYYDPAMTRFINADGYINANGDMLGYNMFAYCGNNSVMGYDPTGEWNWDKFFSGANLLAVGAMAVATAATVLTCGAASPLMVAVATVTATAGLATTVNGVAEIVEAGTDYNVVRDGVMGGDAEAYETYKNVTRTVAEIGTFITGAYLAANGGSVCFAEGTLIATAYGLVPIEDISSGDLVWATNEETGETELKKVVRLFRNETEEWIHITVKGEEITCTPEHPFYSPVKGWMSAIDLRAGDILVMLNGEYVVIEQVQHELLESSETTFNFEVDDFHTYYVGEDSILVHNKCGLNNAQAKKAAQELGYSKVHGVSMHGNSVFTNPKASMDLRYITADVDMHSGGVWKAASSIKKLGSKLTRSGTYDAFLRWIAP